MPVSQVLRLCAGNQKFPNNGGADVELTSSLLYDETKNAFMATGSLPLDDTNSFTNTMAVLFRK